MTLPPPPRRTLLWHLTSSCNMLCRYCYGSFEGGSYRDNLIHGKMDVPLPYLLRTVEDLATLGFERAYMCGGEPFLRKDLWDVLRVCVEQGIERYVLTNGSITPKGFAERFEGGLFSNLSFSLDSLDPLTNDLNRGLTRRITRNIEAVVALRDRVRAQTELGLYVVVTRTNIGQLDSLVDWATSTGLDYVTLQVVYLPESHPFYRELSLQLEDYDTLNGSLEHLLGSNSLRRAPSDSLFEISRQSVMGGKLVARNCFCERELRYLFIDGDGKVRKCPSKHVQPGPPLGNIRVQRLTEMPLDSGSRDRTCTELTADCIGVWEMAHARPARPKYGNPAVVS